VKHPGQISVGTSLTSGSNFGRRQHSTRTASSADRGFHTPSADICHQFCDGFMRQKHRKAPEQISVFQITPNFVVAYLPS